MTELRRYEPPDLAPIVALSLRAWAPVFASVEQAMDPEVYRLQHPDWRVTQRAAVEAACRDDAVETWVAASAGAVAGFAALHFHRDDAIGEVYMIAVDPAFQRRGIAARLTAHALERFRAESMTTAMIETGGDPGHAPARRTYEAAGFRALPSVRYFRKV